LLNAPTATRFDDVGFGLRLAGSLITMKTVPGEVQGDQASQARSEALHFRVATATAGAHHAAMERDPMRLLAMRAQQGSVEHRAEFIERLDEMRGNARVAWLRHARDIGQSWLLEPLTRLLDDREPILDIACCGPTRVLRTCDVATSVIASITGRQFSF